MGENDKNSPNMHENEESRQEVWVTRRHFLKFLKVGGHYKMLLVVKISNKCKMTPSPYNNSAQKRVRENMNLYFCRGIRIHLFIVQLF